MTDKYTTVNQLRRVGDGLTRVNWSWQEYHEVRAQSKLLGYILIVQKQFWIYPMRDLTQFGDKPRELKKKCEELEKKWSWETQVGEF